MELGALPHHLEIAVDDADWSIAHRLCDPAFALQFRLRFNTAVEHMRAFYESGVPWRKNYMQISLINFTKSIEDAAVLRAVRAINRQIRDDFTPYWSWTACLLLDGSTVQNRQSRTRTGRLEQNPPDLRGDAILYLWDRAADVEDAVGYHDQNNRGLPYGFVFTDISAALKEDWSVTLSHEVLELIGDASANTLVAGPHPKERRRTVYHWYEMCDAVQDEHYEIDGVNVSNFVLPLYFTPGEQDGGAERFLERAAQGRHLALVRHQPRWVRRVPRSQDGIVAHGHGRQAWRTAGRNQVADRRSSAASPSLRSARRPRRREGRAVSSGCRTPPDDHLDHLRDWSPSDF